MQESFACVWAWSCVKAICIDGRVVSTSDSESVGPGSIPGGRLSNIFSFFLFFSCLSNNVLIVFSLYFKVE